MSYLGKFQVFFMFLKYVGIITAVQSVLINNVLKQKSSTNFNWHYCNLI